MRRNILAQVPESLASRWQQLIPVLSTATLLAVALGVALRPTGIDHSPLPRTLEKRPESSEADVRRIQFETPGGTLVVWILNPEFPS